MAVFKERHRGQQFDYENYINDEHVLFADLRGDEGAEYRHLVSTGLRAACDNDPSVQKLIRLFCLPFLPPSDKPPTFWHLSLATNTGKLVQHFRYVHATWVCGDTWTPRDWSVFNENVRTNNFLEGWHNRFNSKTVTRKLLFYALVEKLHEESRLTAIYQAYSEVDRFRSHRSSEHFIDQIIILTEQIPNT